MNTKVMNVVKIGAYEDFMSCTHDVDDALTKNIETNYISGGLKFIETAANVGVSGDIVNQANQFVETYKKRAWSEHDELLETLSKRCELSEEEFYAKLVDDLADNLVVVQMFHVGTGVLQRVVSSVGSNDRNLECPRPSSLGANGVSGFYTDVTTSYDLTHDYANYVREHTRNNSMNIIYFLSYVLSKGGFDADGAPNIDIIRDLIPSIFDVNYESYDEFTRKVTEARFIYLCMIVLTGATRDKNLGLDTVRGGTGLHDALGAIVEKTKNFRYDINRAFVKVVKNNFTKFIKHHDYPIKVEKTDREIFGHRLSFSSLLVEYGKLLQSGDITSDRAVRCKRMIASHDTQILEIIENTFQMYAEKATQIKMLLSHRNGTSYLVFKRVSDDKYLKPYGYKSVDLTDTVLHSITEEVETEKA